MRRLQELEREIQVIHTLEALTGAFEGIASLRIAAIKDQVQQGSRFFVDLWRLYSRIRVNSIFGYGRSLPTPADISHKDLYVLITSEGGFAGDIDERLVDLMLKTYQANSHDIIVVGHHGARQLGERNVSYQHYFRMPTRDRNINLRPLIDQVQRYQTCTIFYQQYVTLMVQDVRRIELKRAIQQQGKAVDVSASITEHNYIFEPTIGEVVNHLEHSMMQITLGQLILDSKLAQYASRFRAMSAAHDRADEVSRDFIRTYKQVRRAHKDTQIREVISARKMIGAGS